MQGKCPAQGVCSSAAAEGNEVLQVRKATVDHVLSRNRAGCGCRSYKPGSLIVNEEKRSTVLSVVNALEYRPVHAEGRAKLVLVICGYRLAVTEEDVCIEVCVSKVFPQVSTCGRALVPDLMAGVDDASRGSAPNSALKLPFCSLNSLDGVRRKGIMAALLPTEEPP